MTVCALCSVVKCSALLMLASAGTQGYRRYAEVL